MLHQTANRMHGTQKNELLLFLTHLEEVCNYYSFNLHSNTWRRVLGTIILPHYKEEETEVP